MLRFLLAAVGFVAAAAFSEDATSTKIDMDQSTNSVHKTKLDVKILSATFEYKSIPTYKNETSCIVASQSSVVVLSVIVKVTNVGELNYEVDPSHLRKEHCSDIESYPSFYSISVGGLVKTSSEKCVSDSNIPVSYTCSNQGISKGNYFVSSQWIDLSQSVLTPGAGYDVTVSILYYPHKFLATAISDPFKVTFTTSRKRTLRSQKAYHTR